MQSTRSAETVGGVSADLLEPAAGWAVGAVGLVLVGVGVAHWLVFDPALFDFLIASLPAVTTVAGWAAVRRQGYDRSFYPRLLAWTVAGAAVLGGIVLIALFVQGSELVTALPLLQFIAGIGSTGGLVAGVNEARSVRAAQEAERARVEAEMAEEERERLQFLNHLLRHNVLNKVQVADAYADVVREETTDDLAAELDTIAAQHDDIVEIIENVRVLVRSATEEPKGRDVDLTLLLREEARSLRQSSPQADVDCGVPDGLTAHADPLVRYVFSNLLRNAVEHSDREKPHVVVTATDDGDSVTVRIADDGPGIPEGNKERVFEPTEAGNHGLGLYLVDQLLSDYGGDIRVLDNEPRGAVFEVTLPAGRE